KSKSGLTAGPRGVRLDLGPIPRAVCISAHHFGGIAMRRLITVLVVTLVLVLAGGLVLTAIPRVRAAAAQAQCRNNLKQIGLAVQTYQGTYSLYPPATVPNDDLPCGKRLSWQVHLLPYLDQINLVIDQTKAWDAEENLVLKIRYHDRRDHWVEEPLRE